VSAIQSIGDTINRMNEIASTIASAVEEQGAATQEIARNVEHASQGTGRVSQSIHEVSSAAEHTGVAATDIRSSAHDLTEQSDRLAQEVENFLAAIRPKASDLV
ncbi:MAG TPA: methyl-accepting chemotaxis protein, partial [Magnetovibrio sp.]